MPSSEDFFKVIEDHFQVAVKNNWTNIVLSSENIHRQVGGYPGADHRMPSCCNTMRSLVRDGDEVLKQPPNGNGATLNIRYKLPR